MEQLMVLAMIVLLVIWYRRQGMWKPNQTAHGTACWCPDKWLKRAGMLGSRGLLIGRLMTGRMGKPIRMPVYTHTSVFAPTGAGKGVSLVVPCLLTYTKGSVVVFDPKGELYRMTAAKRRAMGQKVRVLDPFGLVTTPAERDGYNPLLEAYADPERLIDECRAMAESVVVRPPEGEKDPHWNASAVMMITALLVATALFMKDGDKTFSTVREMMTDPVIFKEVIKRLQAHGGLPARLGNQLARQCESEKEMASVISVSNTHCAFMDSALVQAALTKNTFRPAADLRQPGTTLYIVLPIDQLEAQRGWLRLMFGSLLRNLMQFGVRDNGEVLFLLDECASFANGLESLEQAFQLGRGRGIKLMTFWQTVEQAQAAFKGKPSLVMDNSDAQVFFGVNSYPTAELVSKMLGNWTMAVESCNLSYSGGTSNTDAPTSDSRSRSRNWSESRNYSEVSRPLMYPNEILQMPADDLIAFVKGVPPIYAKRLKWYSDPLFRKPSLLAAPLALFRMIRP